MNDIEISKKSIKKPITEIVSNIGLNESDISIYGKYKAKIELKDLKKENHNSKLILVTAMSTTPYGEGKTTVSIGLADALHKKKENVI